jgi:hypothetical protein
MSEFYDMMNIPQPTPRDQMRRERCELSKLMEAEMLFDGFAFVINSRCERRKQNIFIRSAAGGVSE